VINNSSQLFEAERPFKAQITTIWSRKKKNNCIVFFKLEPILISYSVFFFLIFKNKLFVVIWGRNTDYLDTSGIPRRPHVVCRVPTRMTKVSFPIFNKSFVITVNKQSVTTFTNKNFFSIDLSLYTSPLVRYFTLFDNLKRFFVPLHRCFCLTFQLYTVGCLL